MKELLNTETGEVRFFNCIPKGLQFIKVPDGVNVAYKNSRGGIIFLTGPDELSSLQMIWQRPTQPEELPFIDDEPPAYYGNAIRPKPRQRAYALVGGASCER